MTCYTIESIYFFKSIFNNVATSLKNKACKNVTSFNSKYYKILSKVVSALKLFITRLIKLLGTETVIEIKCIGLC